MKTLLLGMLLFSFPGFRVAANPSPKGPVDPVMARTHRGGGRWYLAANGHAVYCLGPVVTINLMDGGLRRVATYCQGEKPLVTLKD
jgi:hypothetical protein